MGEETIVLILLVIVMLVGSYMAGSIPLVMKLSEEKLKFVTVLGAGLLVGTALTVIIPEGIRSLYLDGTSHSHIQQKILTSSSAVAPVAAVASQTQTQTNGEDGDGDGDHSRTIGVSLVLGFVFMMLVDQISQHKSADSEKNITATIGLVVHAAADGVALGAAATTSHQDVEIIVFLAIMLHKAPAAFGLVSFLMHERIDRQQIRKHLAIFACSAPLFTLLTYFGIGQEQKETLNSVNATGIAMLFSAGTFLYVATVHVLPELTHGHGHHGSHGSQYDYRVLSTADNNDEVVVVEGVVGGGKTRISVPAPALAPPPHHKTKGLRWSELTIMICGALLPLILTMGHHH